MQERRAYWRVNIQDKISCQIIDEPDRQYPVTDISPAGISFSADREFPIAMLLQLRIILKTSSFVEKNEVTAKVNNCRRLQDKFIIGCSYVRRNEPKA
ncbi:MAG: PilZ domain-containing protein [Candidatus Omnitrophica bacterium]|nr:PilZ domain-containing protein [Candidatus Omnitrophota bacterium]